MCGSRSSEVVGSPLALVSSWTLLVVGCRWLFPSGVELSTFTYGM